MIHLNKKYYLPLASVILIATILLIGLSYFEDIKNFLNPSELKNAEDNIVTEGIGEVMVKNEETGEYEKLVTPITPPDIFSTAGIITKVEEESLILWGEGSNFADKEPREIKCLFDNDKVIFDKNYNKQGVDYLKEGMKIIVGSDENIRGKILFSVKSINILK
jgi:hypothetical protein